jgi:hypothetical protein
LKWIRKPNRTVEHIDREKDIENGLGQIAIVRDYAKRDPDFLRVRGNLKKPLTAYKNVYHLLLVRDFWYWVEPSDNFVLFDFDVFLKTYKTSSNLHELVTELLRYDWLPTEGKDFRVEYTSSSLNGVSVESPEFKASGAPGSRPDVGR